MVGEDAWQTRRRHRQPTCQLDAASGACVRLWPSQKSAADALGIHPSSIAKAVKCGYVSGGFRWAHHTPGSGGAPTAAAPSGESSVADSAGCNEAAPSQSSRTRTTLRPVRQIDLASGTVVRVFPSQSSAARGVDRSESSIRQAIMGKSRSSGGFRWEFVGEDDDSPASAAAHSAENEEDEEDEKDEKGRTIEQLDPDTGEVLACWGSSQAAGRALGLSHDNVGKVLRGTQQVAGGFKWRVAGDKSDYEGEPAARVGARVSVRFDDGFRYGGTVSRIRGGALVVAFDDGTEDVVARDDPDLELDGRAAAPPPAAEAPLVEAELSSSIVQVSDYSSNYRAVVQYN